MTPPEQALTSSRQAWYACTAIQFEIVKALRHRELFIVADPSNGTTTRKGLKVRWLNAQHVAIFNKFKAAYHFDDMPSNLYFSLAYYDKIPLMNLHLGQRAHDYKDWEHDRPSHWHGMDFGLDLDYKEGSWRTALPDAHAISHLFNRYKVPYAHWPTDHGFHFILPWDKMPTYVKTLDRPRVVAFYRKIGAVLARQWPHVDQKIYMDTMVLKLPYSLTKTGMPILPGLPLNEKDILDGLAYAQDEPDALRGRGWAWTNPGGTIDTFLDEWEA